MDNNSASAAEDCEDRSESCASDMEEAEDEEYEFMDDQNEDSLYARSSTPIDAPSSRSVSPYFFNVSESDEFFDHICLEVDDIRDLTGEPLSMCFYLLQRFSWNKSALERHFISLTCGEGSVGVIPFSQNEDLKVHLPDSHLTIKSLGSTGMTCQICCDELDDQANPGVSLGCDHFTCKCCLMRFWDTFLTEGERKPDPCALRCMISECPFVAHPRLVIEALSLPVGDEANPEAAVKTIRQYKKWLSKEFATGAPDIVQCPAPSCGRLMRLPHPFSQLSASSSPHSPSDNAEKKCSMLACLCGGVFCAGCGSTEDHTPAPCSAEIMWSNRVEEHLAEDRVPLPDMRHCPRCNVLIQRVSGCNHLVCGSCRHEFCWICLQHCPQHKHPKGGCNKVEDAERVLADGPSKKQFLHYYVRVQAHAASARIESDLALVLERMQNDRIDVCALTTAHQLLQRCRRALKHSFIYAFWMLTNRRLQSLLLFECHQQELERNVERLSFLVEHLVLDLTVAVGDGDVSVPVDDLRTKRRRSTSSSQLSRIALQEPLVVSLPKGDPPVNLVGAKGVNEDDFSLDLTGLSHRELLCHLQSCSVAAERFLDAVLNATVSEPSDVPSEMSSASMHPPAESWYCSVCSAPRRTCVCSVAELLNEFPQFSRRTVEQVMAHFRNEHLSRSHLQKMAETEKQTGQGFEEKFNWWRGLRTVKR